MNILALIPHYNHPTTVGTVARSLRAHGLDVLVVDDCSRPDCIPVLENLASNGIRVIRRTHNGGKGAAVRTGFEAAA